MKTAKTHSAFLVGLKPVPVTVTAHESRKGVVDGLSIVGLPSDAATRETKVRVLSALAALDVRPGGVVVAVEPPPPPGCSSQLDLAVAVAVLACLGKCPGSEALLLGELALDGRVRPVRGVLPILDQIPGVTAVVPHDNAREAAIASHAYAVKHLGVAVDALSGKLNPEPLTRLVPRDSGELYPIRLRDFIGDEGLKRRIRDAAREGKSILLVGPPGCGKTMIARALVNELPPPSWAETLATTKVHSVAGLVDPEIGYVARRPFRAPHHSVSEAGLVGGGTTPRPGEVSLAHGGVLFLDEVAEFRRAAIDGLRHVRRHGEVRIGCGKSYGFARYPAAPLLVGAANPCPCGYLGHQTRECRCTDERVASYMKRVPRDLFDVVIEVPAVRAGDLVGKRTIGDETRPDDGPGHFPEDES